MRDIDDIRRDNLRLIERDAGSATAAAKLLEMSLSQFTNLRDGAKDSKTGNPRGMHKKTARRIERLAGKPIGWLDEDHAGGATDAAPVSSRDAARHWRAVADAVARNLAGVPVKAADFLELVDAIVADALPPGSAEDEIDEDVRRYLMALSMKSLTPA